VGRGPFPLGRKLFGAVVFRAFLFRPARQLWIMAQTITIRRATRGDIADVDRLLARSYPRLLAADYPASVMVLAVPIIARARPELLASGKYFLALDATGRVVGAGGWSLGHPGGKDAGASDTGHVRHVATDPDMVRMGVGRKLMGEALADAARSDVRRMECLSTRTAVSFYEALGFRVVGATEVTLQPGIVFPAVRMLADLPH
jgi:N-acetylglutamate synthase-like GNAT family acetyltransferase